MYLDSSYHMIQSHTSHHQNTLSHIQLQWCTFVLPNSTTNIDYSYNMCATTFNYNFYLVDYVTQSSLNMQIAAKQFAGKLLTFSA